MLEWRVGENLGEKQRNGRGGEMEGLSSGHCKERRGDMKRENERKEKEKVCQNGGYEEL